MPIALSPQERFETQLLTAEELIHRICERHRFAHDETDDFCAFAMLKLIDDDYARLRSFQGRSRLKTFLTVILYRLLLDYQAANISAPHRSTMRLKRPHSDVRYDGLTGDLEKVELLEACYDLSKAGQEKNFQLRVLDVAGRHEQQLAGPPL
jgi:DNA-directed RNA polymerase specialized sigma24 family protein